jgi:protoheme IX farnesyltransferase
MGGTGSRPLFNFWAVTAHLCGPSSSPGPYSLMIESGTSTTVESTTEVLDQIDARRRSRMADYVELTKPRLTMLSVLTTLAGYWVGAIGPLDPMHIVNTLVGTFLVGGGCGALNMYVEREHDVLMRRTMTRPLPAGRLRPSDALIFGSVISIVGLAWLALTVNLLTAALGLATLVSYVFLYTPLKRRSTLNTVVGAIPGALPPVMGWAAARGALGPEAIVLFGILFFWQMPHFLALAWMYRRDYERAGYKMLTVLDPDGGSTSRQILLYTAALLPISLIPTLFGIAGGFYFFGALAIGLGFLAFGAVLAVSRKNVHAKWLFYYSLLYLPVLLLTMVIDRGSA